MDEIGNGEKFAQLRDELLIYQDFLSTATDKAIRAGYSKYPVFIFHKNIVNLGVAILDGDHKAGKWSIHLSSLEEIIAASLISESRIDDFIGRYDSPTIHFCLLVFSELGVNFIFIKRNK